MALCLTVMMVLANAFPAFALTSMSAGSGLGKYSGPKGDSVWNDSAQFLRITVLWAPFAEPGDNYVDTDGITWDPYKVKQIGSSFDWAYGNGLNPKYLPVQHSNFTNAYYYNKTGYVDRMGIDNSYENWGRSWLHNDGDLVSSSGKVLQFPRRVGGANKVDIKSFFEEYPTLNQVLAIVKQTPKGIEEVTNGCLGDLDVKTVQKGIYLYENGSKEYGKYVILVEPGVYMTIKGVYSAFTLRDALAWGRGGATSEAPSAVASIANSVYLQQNAGTLFKDIGLEYSKHEEFSNVTNNLSASQYDRLKKTEGVGLVWFTPEQPQTQIINYYYVLQPNEYEVIDGKIKIKQEAFERRADTADEELVPSAYEAPSNKTKKVNGVERKFVLAQAYMESVDDVDGYMDIFSNSLQFVNKSGTPEITYKLRQFIGDESLTQDDMKEWANARATAANVQEIKRLTGLEEKYDMMHNTGTGSLSINLGNSAGKVQSNFLYLCIDEPIPPYFDEPDDPETGIVTVKPGTFVTKMYYESAEATVPSEIKSEPLSRDASYKIPSKEDLYAVTDWVTVPDKTTGAPETFSTYDEASSESIKSGSGATTLQIDSWSDPDAELFIKFVKQPAQLVESELVLPEKRISWLKDLSHIGGIPTISFEWEARDGSETHYCDSDKCKGHSCNEGIGKDNVLNFISSNTVDVKGTIMGNAAGFFPYDEANEYGFNPSKSAGTYEMHPNYGYVIWRGQDVPTIASYKYGSGTGNEVSSAVPGVSSLLGSNMIGISPKGARNAANHSYYMDNFHLVIGKSNYDCTRYGAFQSAFGSRATGDNKVNEFVEEKHKLWDKYEDDVAAYNRAVAEYERAKRAYEEIDSLDSYWEESMAKARLNNAKNVMNAAEKAKLETATGFNAISAKLGLTNSPLNEGDIASEKLEMNIGDYDYSSRWSYCGRRTWYTASGDQTDFDADVRVDVEYGNPNLGNAVVDFNSQNLTAKGQNYTHVQGFAINNTSPIGFYPYVEMLYDTTAGKETDNVVYTLGGHKSQIIPRDYIEIGYLVKSANAETTTGLVLQSKQWSTHQKAVQGLSGGQKNKVLPGGAIYRLQTPGAGTNGNTRTKVALSSWYTYLPADTIDATVEGKDKYNMSTLTSKNEKLFREVMNSLNSLDIVQVVDGTTVDQAQAGVQRVPGTSGQPTSPDMKYWMKQNLKDGSGTAGAPGTNEQAMKVNSKNPAEADLDIISHAEEKIYYRVYSDVKGNVYVSKSTTSERDTMVGKGTILGRISKEQGLADLLAQNTEIQALNNRTKVVENFIKAIDRNTGNDATVADAKWYNEAWDGICVVRINKIIEVGFKDNDANNAARTAAIDPKLQPKRDSQGDLYMKGIKSWFETDKHTNFSAEPGYVGTFDATSTGGGQIKVILKDMNGLYRSKDFIIPNASVMDLY